MSTFADLSGRWVVVVGGSTGIGRAIVEECARGGANVVVHYHSSQENAEEVRDNAIKLGPESFIQPCDLNDAGAVSQFVSDVWKRTSGIDAWVHNAGVDILTGDAAKWSFSEKLAALLSVDVTGTVLATKAVGALMRGRGSGSILTIGWDQAERGMEGDSGELFAAAKNAIMGYTRSLAVSLAPQVRVNCIAPGWIQTKWGVTASEAWQARVLAETPMKRWGKPEDIAKLTRFLISDEANYLTGQVINANGGAVR